MDTRPMAIVTAPGVIEFQQRPLPPHGPHDVLIKVKAVSICGSDLHIFKGAHPAAPLPVPIGHELAGQVAQVGAQVSTLEVGDRVVIEPVIACDACHFCRRGQYHLCTQISFQYRVGQGGFTSDFIVPARWAHKLPAHISYAEGALVEPLSVAIHAIQKSGLPLGGTSAIFGAGAIGLLLLQLLRLSGGGGTFIVDVQEHRLKTALELGASRVFNNLTHDAVAEIVAAAGGLGVDRAFEAVGLQVTLSQALASLRKGGAAVLVGLFAEPKVSLPANIFVQKEIALLGSQGYCWDFQTALSLLAANQLDLSRLITHQLPLSEIQTAFDLLLDPHSQAIKVVIQIDE